MVERVFLPTGRFGPCSNADTRYTVRAARGPKGREEFLFEIFLALPENMNFISHPSPSKGLLALLAHMVKHPLAMQETQVQPLRQEGPLEKEMATHSSILAWRIPWTEEPGRLQSLGSQKAGHD